jgi:hypothetical protein
VVSAEKRTFGGLPGVWRGGSHPKRWQTSPDTVSRVIGRGSGYPIRSIFRDNPSNVRQAYTVTWEVCWPLIGQNIKMTNFMRDDVKNDARQVRCIAFGVQKSTKRHPGPDTAKMGVRPAGTERRVRLRKTAEKKKENDRCDRRRLIRLNPRSFL